MNYYYQKHTYVIYSLDISWKICISLNKASKRRVSLILLWLAIFHVLLATLQDLLFHPTESI